MADRSIAGRRILVVEDEYLLADDLAQELRDAGAEVLGPVATVGDAQTIIGSGEQVDAAVLDVNLRGEMVFPLADELTARRVPFAFITGYDSTTLPPRFADTPRFAKPINVALIKTLIGPLAAGG